VPGYRWTIDHILSIVALNLSFGHLRAMDNNAKIEEVLKEAEAILAEIVDQGPTEELADIWEV
jgi:hypothetical protein